MAVQKNPKNQISCATVPYLRFARFFQHETRNDHQLFHESERCLEFGQSLERKWMVITRFLFLCKKQLMKSSELLCVLPTLLTSSLFYPIRLRVLKISELRTPIGWLRVTH